ncbi:MAG: HNH endonuclease [Candidimonas sp.]
MGVKTNLLKKQNGKCVFCQIPLKGTDEHDHDRPVLTYRDKRDFTTAYLSCFSCQQDRNDKKLSYEEYIFHVAEHGRKEFIDANLIKLRQKVFQRVKQYLSVYDRENKIGRSKRKIVPIELVKSYAETQDEAVLVDYLNSILPTKIEKFNWRFRNTNKIRLYRLSEEQNHRCAYCGCHVILPQDDHFDDAQDPKSATIDHVIPISLGGSNFDHNCVVSCYRCNSLKNSMDAMAFYHMVQDFLVNHRDEYHTYKIITRNGKIIATNHNRENFRIIGRELNRRAKMSDKFKMTKYGIDTNYISKKEKLNEIQISNIVEHIIFWNSRKNINETYIS